MATPFTFFIKMYERRGGLRTPDPFDGQGWPAKPQDFSP